MIRKLACAFLIAALAPSARAQAYLGLALGQAKYRNACAGAASSITCSSDDTSLRIFGGYRFNPYVALEAGGSSLGTVRASTGETAELEAFDVSALVSWPLGNRFAVHARLGVYSGDTTAAPRDYAVPAVFPPRPAPPRVGWESGNTFGATYGLGASFEVAPNAVFRLEWQRFDYFGSSDPYGYAGPTIGVDVYSIGGMVRF